MLTVLINKQLNNNKQKKNVASKEHIKEVKRIN